MFKAISPVECTAVHEAGHVIARVAFGYLPKSVTIEPAYKSDGQVEAPPDWLAAEAPDPVLGYDYRTRLEIEVIVDYAGPLAQAYFSQRAVDWAAGSNDQEHLDRTLRLLFPISSERVRQKFARAYERRAWKLVRGQAQAIERLARDLLAYGTLSGEQIAALCPEVLGSAREEVPWLAKGPNRRAGQH